MFNKKNAGYHEGMDTLVGLSTTITGNIEAEGTVRVDGKVKGNIVVTGDVYIGDQASITGNIEAANVHMSGRVDGNIAAKGILKIQSTAKLYGDINVNSFVVDEGAFFQGKCTMMSASPVDLPAEKNNSKKNYKKSSVIEEVSEEK